VDNSEKKILFVCPHPQNVAAGQRLKFEPHFNFLKEQGYSVKQSCFMSKRLWDIAYEPGNYLKKFFLIITGLIERVFLLFHLYRFDIVYIHMNVFPFGPAILERLFRRFSKKLIFDIEDNIISSPPKGRNRLADLLKSKSKYEYLIKKSNVVIASTPALANKCNEIAGQDKSVFIPPTLDDERFVPRITSVKNERLTIGWTGTFSSKQYLDIVLPSLESLYRERDFKVKIIGNFEITNPALDLEVVQWNEKEEINQLHDIDIGLYPLPEDDWVSGKSGLKAMQYMAIGIPAVSTAVGNVLNIIEDEVDGILVYEENEWKQKLKILLDDEMKRNIIGKNARKTFLSKYSRRKISRLYLQTLNMD
jgi:glycosyltransferase involved in cell wall biosynthesis